MRGKFGAALGLFIFTFVSISPSFAQGAAGAGTGSGLRDDLTKQYKPVKLGNNAGSTIVTDTGTVLVVQMAGLFGVPPSAVVNCPAHFKDGSLHAPNMLCKAALRNTGKDLSNGDKVYPMKFDVNLQKEEVSMTILECDTCNSTDPPTYFHSQVIFQFPKGYLESAGSDQVEDTIGKLFVADTSSNNNDNGGNNQQQGNGNGQDQGNGQQGQAQGGQQQQQPAQPPPPPASVQLGQTPDQVIAALGQPDKIVTLGTKQIYVYKDLKVTFVNGKVTDAQ